MIKWNCKLNKILHTMEINKKPIKKSLLITCLVLVVAFSCTAIYIYLKSKAPDIITSTTNIQKIDYTTPSTEQKQAGDDQKITNQTPVSTTVSTTITAKNVTADTLQIRSMTSGAISNDGTCNLTLTNGIAVISKTAATYAMPSSSTCQGFDIARTELSNGTWQINLDVIIDGEKSSATGEVTLE